MHDPAFRKSRCRATSPPVVAPQVRRQSEALITGREKVVLFGRPLRRSRHESADRDAGVSLYGQHVPTPRVSRAGGQFEFRVVLLHLRNACPSRFLQTSGVLSGPLAPPVSPPPAAARGPPTPRAPRTARACVLAVPMGRCWLFQDFSLRRLLPGAARSVHLCKFVKK